MIRRMSNILGSGEECEHSRHCSVVEPLQGTTGYAEGINREEQKTRGRKIQTWRERLRKRD